MRQIHPVSFHETFVASGVYTYYEDGNPRDVHEYWSIHELPDGGRLIRVDIAELLVEAWVSPVQEGGRIERADLHYLGNSRGRLKEQGKASYVFEADKVQLGYTIENKPRQFEEISLPANYVVYIFFSSLFMGFLVVTLAKSDGDRVPVCVCSVDYPIPPTDELSFSARVAELRQRSGIPDNVTIDGKMLSVFRYLEEGPPRPLTHWIDEHNILLRSEYLDAMPHVLLTQYARRPEPPTP